MAGYTVWVAGQRVNFDTFNDHVQEQVIARFASTAARDAAITAPETGQEAATLDAGRKWIYDGSAWVENGRWDGSETWTPVIDQGATTNIAKSIGLAIFVRQGNVVDAWCTLTPSANGTAGSAVTVTLPVAPSGYSANDPIGHGHISDTSAQANSKVCQVWFNSGSTCYFQAATVTGSGRWGTDPNIALASGDSIRFHVRYLVA